MTRKMKKLALPVAALSMASVPVLAQDGFENAFTEEEQRAMAGEAGLGYADPNLTRFSCGFLNSDNSTICEADENGFYTTESGVRFPVFGDDSAKNGASYIQYGGVPGSEPPTRPG
ncbi:MAG: hypothetical protein H0X71_02855 [Rubrobacter sp.]|nr:hypothetical protein [Rubrobacter sp.]